jgi:alpha-galactosidase
LLNRYWGPRLPDEADLPTLEELCDRDSLKRKIDPAEFSEYAGWGGYAFSQPALKASFADGTRDVLLRYVSHQLAGDCLDLIMHDECYPLQVTLHYRVHETLDLIERSAEITNLGQEPIVLENMFSATWHLPEHDLYRLTWLAGGWAREYQMQQQPIADGQIVLQTKTGLSGPDAAPFFMIDEDGAASETHGGVYYGTLLWSGNWKMIFERNKFRQVSVTGGVNDFDCTWCLSGGETWSAPVFAAGYTEGGFGQVSRNIHRYEREVVMHPVEAKRIMPVIYNAYGTFFAQVNAEKIIGAIDIAHALGIECLIIDAGWAGRGDNYAQGMGEWQVNPERFPDGLRPIADRLHERGMLFGLWMEPEVVHVDSPLIREHPDWVLGYEERQPDRHGVRMVLNFARDDVRDAITQKTLDLIKQYDIDYFKIDFNRLIAHAGWPQAPYPRQKEVWVRYVRNVLAYFKTVKQKFPNILFENCASGGMRVDLEMLRFSGRINRSDNQDPLDVLKLHEGFSMFMLPKLAGGGCHISDVFTRHFNQRVSTMKFQAHTAMMGSLAVGKNLLTMDADEQTELKEYLALYKRIRPIVHLGNLYRLASAWKKPYAAFQYLTQTGDEGVVFAFGQSMQFTQYPERLRLQGLEPEARYRVDGYGERSGTALMTVGIPLNLIGDMDSRVILLQRLG